MEGRVAPCSTAWTVIAQPVFLSREKSVPGHPDFASTPKFDKVHTPMSSATPLHAAFISRPECGTSAASSTPTRRERIASTPRLLPVTLTPKNLDRTL